MFPYVTPNVFELRIAYSATDFELSTAAGTGTGDASEWGTVVADILETESERVEAPEYAGGEWRDEDDTPPAVVKDAVVALAQHSLAQIKERGLDKESLGSGASGSGGSYTYTPAGEVRATVKQDLADAGYGSYGAPTAQATGRPSRRRYR